MNMNKQEIKECNSREKHIKGMLKNGEYRGVIQQVELLSNDYPEYKSYYGLVFMGMSYCKLDETSTSISKFELAIQMQPNTLEAYQGLIKTYEYRSLPYDYPKLIVCYNKLLSLINDDSVRICEFLLTGLFKTQYKSNEIEKAAKTYLRLEAINKPNYKLLFDYYMISRKNPAIVENEQICLKLIYSDEPDVHNILVSDLLKYYLTNECTVSRLDCLDQYILHVNSKRKCATSQSWLLYRIMMSFHLAKACDQEGIFTEIIQFISNNKKDLNEHMNTNKLEEFLSYYASGESKNMLEITSILNFDIKLLNAQVDLFVIDLVFKKNSFELAESLISEYCQSYSIYKDIQNQQVQSILKKKKMICYYHMKEFTKSLKLYVKIKDNPLWINDTETFYIAGCIHLDNNQDDFSRHVDNVSQEIKNSKLYKILMCSYYFKNNQYNTCKDICEQLLKQFPDWYLPLSFVCRCAFALSSQPQNEDKLKDMFIKAIASDNGYCSAVRMDYIKYLSLFEMQYMDEMINLLYEIVGKDIKHSPAAKMLTEFLLKLGKIENAKEILVSVLALDLSEMNWAYSLYARILDKEGNFSEAVNFMQIALQHNRIDSMMWDQVGDLYVKRGSLGSAVKAYEASAKIDNGIYSRYRTAFVKHHLGELEDAKNIYLEVLNCEPDYILALAGISDTYMKLADRCHGKFMDGRCKDYCEKALFMTCRLIDLQSNYISAWKNAGDCCIMAAKLGFAQFNIPTRLIEFNADHDKVGSLTTVEAVLDLACLLYSRAIRLRPTDAWLWQDIAYTKLLAARNLSVELFVGLKFIHKNDATDMDTDMEVLMHPKGGIVDDRGSCHYHDIEKETAEYKENSQRRASKRHILLLDAADLCKRSIAHFSRHPANQWNTLGLIYLELHKFTWAMHCFIKATKVFPLFYQAWCNIAAMYVMMQKYEVAHKIFDHCVCLKPGHINIWIGKTMAYLKENSKHAIDIIRHASLLDVHPVSEFWLAHCEIKHILGGKKSSDEQLSRASDAFERYTTRYPKDIGMLRSFASFLELSKNYRYASSIYRKIIIELNRIKSMDNFLCYNMTIAYALNLCKSGNLNEAFNSIETLTLPLNAKQTYDCALVAFYCKNWQLSAQMYNGAFSKTNITDVSLHKDLSMCIAVCQYRLGDSRGALQLMSHCSSVNNAGINVHKMLCALLLLTMEQENISHIQLIHHQFERLQHEMNNYHVESADSVDMEFLIAYYRKMVHGSDKLLSYLQKNVMLQPDKWFHWDILARQLFYNGQNYQNCKLAKAIKKCSNFKIGLKAKKDLLYPLMAMCCGELNGHKDFIKYCIHTPCQNLNDFKDALFFCQYIKAMESFSIQPISINNKMPGQSQNSIEWNAVLNYFNQIRVHNNSDNSDDNSLEELCQIYPENLYLRAHKNEIQDVCDQPNLVFFTQFAKYNLTNMIDIDNKLIRNPMESRIRLSNDILRTLFLKHITKSKDYENMDMLYKKLSQLDAMNPVLFMLQSDIFKFHNNIRGERYCLQMAINNMSTAYFSKSVINYYIFRLIKIYHSKGDVQNIQKLLSECDDTDVFQYYQSLH